MRERAGLDRAICRAATCSGDSEGGEKSSESDSRSEPEVHRSSGPCPCTLAGEKSTQDVGAPTPSRPFLPTCQNMQGKCPQSGPLSTRLPCLPISPMPRGGVGQGTRNG